MAVWLPPEHTHTHTPGPWLFTCQVKGLKSETEGGLTRKQGTYLEENEYAGRLECEGEGQK